MLVFDSSWQSACSSLRTMPEQESDTIDVHCGRCGKPMTVNLQDIKDNRLIDCAECETCSKRSEGS